MVYTKYQLGLRANLGPNEVNGRIPTDGSERPDTDCDSCVQARAGWEQPIVHSWKHTEPCTSPFVHSSNSEIFKLPQG